MSISTSEQTSFSSLSFRKPQSPDEEEGGGVGWSS